ncbi:MAG: hypothetical protein JNL30_04170 [Rubrivivax sp.]|nr:hypothetical protein [Rubrivivax sp.]
MDHREFHVMNAELIGERQTMRYTCPTCRRCMEDGPDGITVLHAGDRRALHRAGTVKAVIDDIDTAAPVPPHTLH